MRAYLSKSFLVIVNLVPLLLALVGAALFSFAIAMVYLPAGLAVGALFLLYAAYDASQSGVT